MHEVMLELAHQIIRDGEGAEKFLSITVKGALSNKVCEDIAKAIAGSSLVKTAFSGNFANWGRVIAAIGKTKYPVDRDTLAINIGEMEVIRDGELSPDYNENAVNNYIKNPEIDIFVSVGTKKISSTIWTCDLTYAYVDINTDYIN
jgi:glutamate N-acetyltransferase/amino-acid N-acetyltransferase